MSNRSPTVARALIATSFLICAWLTGAPAHAETAIFRDVLRPHGVARSQAQKFADGHACGASANQTYNNAPVFEACMRGRGWALDHVRADSGDPGGAVYDDMWQPAHGARRGDAELQQASRVCDPSGSANPATAAQRACMLKQGWRLSFNRSAPASSVAEAPSNPLGDTVVWADATGRSRSHDLLDVDTAACGEQVGPDVIGQPTSAAYKSCMARRGWRYDRTKGPTTWISTDPDSYGERCHPILGGFGSICSNME